MNGKAARTLRKFLGWSGTNSVSTHRAHKRAYKQLSHRKRGATRLKMIAAMAKDPRKLPAPYVPRHVVHVGGQ